MESEILQSSMALNTTPNMTVIAAQQPANEWIEMLHTINFTEIGILFIAYFIGGYLLYSSLFAAIGSAVDGQEDTQQFMLPVTLLLVFALYAGIYSMENPDGPLAFWCSMIPFTSPIVMMVRCHSRCLCGKYYFPLDFCIYHPSVLLGFPPKYTV